MLIFYYLNNKIADVNTGIRNVVLIRKDVKDKLMKTNGKVSERRLNRSLWKKSIRTCVKRMDRSYYWIIGR